MNLQKLGLVCIFLAGSMPSFAEAKSKWVQIWDSKPGQSKLEIKFDSVKSFDNILKTRTLSALFRTTTPKGKVYFSKYLLTDEDCSNGFGNLTEDYLDGSPQEKVSFVIGGGNGNSLIAETICTLAGIEIKK